ncbi:amino acid permease [Algoriphagus boritolerans]|uniref:amino acid permease n=1 Tax=Algoriphagus boritolerans TaxID=308111 RepID=UPI002FCE5603
MLCFAEAGSKVTHSGGAYAYVETAFGPFPGFLVSVFYLTGSIFADAAVSNALVEILALIFPVFKNPTVRVLSLFFLFFWIGHSQCHWCQTGDRFGQNHHYCQIDSDCFIDHYWLEGCAMGQFCLGIRTDYPKAGRSIPDFVFLLLWVGMQDWPLEGKSKIPKRLFHVRYLSVFRVSYCFIS